MTDTITGKVWVFGHDINTDLVIPNFAVLLPREEQTRHCFNANRPGWVDHVQPGDILIAGTNFGVGSGRPIGDIFADLGISLIVAESFNGLGLRNCVNLGIPCLPCEGVTDLFAEGDVASVAWKAGEVRNLTKGTQLMGEPLPKAVTDIVDGGGVMPILKKEGFLPA
jgi:3-isopropylmalate/(R)-2-methylmalate dehydratase small subunit